MNIPPDNYQLIFHAFMYGWILLFKFSYLELPSCPIVKHYEMLIMENYGCIVMCFPSLKWDIHEVLEFMHVQK